MFFLPFLDSNPPKFCTIYSISVIVQITIHFVVRHQIYDEYGKVVFSKEVKDNPDRGVMRSYKKTVKSFYDAIADGQLYKCRESGPT